VTIKFLDVQGIADELGVDVQTVRRWIHEGKLPAIKPGKEFRVRESDLEEFLESTRVEPEGKAPGRSPHEPPSLNDGLEEERRGLGPKELLPPSERRLRASMRLGELERMSALLAKRAEELRELAKKRHGADDRHAIFDRYLVDANVARGVEGWLDELRAEAREFGGETEEERGLRDHVEHRIEELEEANDRIGAIWRELVEAETAGDAGAEVIDIHKPRPRRAG